MHPPCQARERTSIGTPRSSRSILPGKLPLYHLPFLFLCPLGCTLAQLSALSRKGYKSMVFGRAAGSVRSSVCGLGDSHCQVFTSHHSQVVLHQQKCLGLVRPRKASKAPALGLLLAHSWIPSDPPLILRGESPPALAAHLQPRDGSWSWTALRAASRPRFTCATPSTFIHS